MRRLVVDWQGLHWGEGGFRLWCTCHVCALSLTTVRDTEMRCCVTFDLVEINSVPARTDLPLWLCPLWPQRQGYRLQNMWLADCVTQPKVGGLITSSKSAASVMAASAWREWDSLVWSYGRLLLKEQRREGSDISTNPPSVMAFPAPSSLCPSPR